MAYPLSRVFPVVPALFLVLGVRAAGFSRSELVVRTPFFRPVAGAPTGGSGGAYELRGFFGRAGGCEVSIRQSDTGRSEWVRVGANATGGGYFVESADVGAGTAVLVVAGRRVALRLARAESGSSSGSMPLNYDIRRHKRTGPERYDDVTDGQVTPFTRARDAGLERLRAEHPEYFTNINALTEEQRRAAANAINEVTRRAAAETAGEPSGS